MVAQLQATARGENWDAKPWRGRFIEALDRSGVLGSIMDVNNSMEGLSFGHIRLRPALGVGGAGDLNHAVGALGGPTGSTAINVLQSIFGNPADPATRSAQLRLVPLHNIWQHKALLNLVAKQHNQTGQGPAFDR